MLEGTALRPAWGQTVAALEHLGADELEGRVATADRLIREFGVSYNVYSNPSGSKDWAMDIVPLVLDGAEWAFLEDALSQRFHLLNLVLEDCYGDQRLLEGGHLPAELVVGNPRFLPAAHRLLPRGFKHLQFYSADLARSADGPWWVLSDRLDAPSGFGYALENRALSHRLLPEAIRSQPVRSLDPFVDAFCNAIAGLAPRDVDEPHVVLLTPGSHNETYFEHSFLARTLGYPLVEGDDLTVRDGRVYLKTIGGMRQVDVILRRVDSEWCDPLELQPDSLLGVPGLLHAVRGGQVAVANAIGSGLFQSPATSAFLPALSRQLLGEDLKIPSVATWWCGGERERQYVLDNLASLVIKPAKAAGATAAVMPGTLSTAELAAWRRRIEWRPGDWCAQELVNQATTPVFRGGAFQPAHFLMRVHLVRDQGRYRLMPGGLARVAGEPGFQVSMQAGGISKDVWVTGPAPGTAPPARDGGRAPSHPHGIVRRSTHSLTSRTADNLFWLGRYLERVEWKARVTRTLVDGLMDESAPGAAGSIPLLLTSLSPDEAADDLVVLTEPPTPRRKATPALNLQACEQALAHWFDPEKGGFGLRADIDSVLRIASTVRERLSLETWNATNNLGRAAADLPPARLPVIGDRTLQTLDELVGLLAGTSGLFMENMTRGDSWLFQDLGRRIERALQLCHLAGTTLVPARGDLEHTLRLLLICSDSLITYRRRYLTALHPVSVIDLLVFDPANPRSLAFQVDRVNDHLDGLPHRRDSAGVPNAIDRAAIRLKSHIGLGDPAGFDLRGRGRRQALDRFLRSATTELGTLSDQIARHYFALNRRRSTAGTAPQRPLGPI